MHLHIKNKSFLNILLSPQCKKKHTLVCPDFSSKGACPLGSKCKLHHRERVKRTSCNANSVPAKRARNRDVVKRSGRIKLIAIYALQFRTVFCILILYSLFVFLDRRKGGAHLQSPQRQMRAHPARILRSFPPSSLCPALLTLRRTLMPQSSLLRQAHRPKVCMSKRNYIQQILCAIIQIA